jgi:hypothetical protein
MEYFELLDRIEDLTIEDLKNPKITLEDIINMHSSLNFDNPLTYKIFLASRADLSDAEINIINQIIFKLEKNIKLKFEFAKENAYDLELIESIQDDIVITPSQNPLV